MTMHALTIFVEGCINMLLTKRLFCMFMNRIRAQKKKKKKNRGQYPAILTEKAWSIKDLLFYYLVFKEIYLAGHSG